MATPHFDPPDIAGDTASMGMGGTDLLLLKVPSDGGPPTGELPPPPAFNPFGGLAILALVAVAIVGVVVLALRRHRST